MHNGGVEVNRKAFSELLIRKWNKPSRGEDLRRWKNRSIVIPNSIGVSSRQSNLFVSIYNEPAARLQKDVSWRSALLRHLRITIDQDTMRGVITRSRNVRMVSSMGSLQVGMNGVQKNRNTSGLPRTLALKQGLRKGFLLRLCAVAFIILMAMHSIFGRRW